MPKVMCPTCFKEFKAPERILGKKATCSGCGLSFIAEEVQIEDDPLLPEESPSVPEIKLKPQPIRTKNVSDDKTVSLWKVFVPSLIGTLLIGYFIGREHLKFEIKSVVEDARHKISKELGNIPFGNSENSDNEKVRKTTQVKKEIQLVPLGEKLKTENFDLTVTAAVIDLPFVVDVSGDLKKGREKKLQIFFEIFNTHDRKLLNIIPNYSAVNFTIKDDVGNTLKPFYYGRELRPLGTQKDTEDIMPRTYAKHIEYFNLPPPKTKYLILTVKLLAIGGSGEAKFRIDASQIKE